MVGLGTCNWCKKAALHVNLVEQSHVQQLFDPTVRNIIIIGKALPPFYLFQVFETLTYHVDPWLLPVSFSYQYSTELFCSVIIPSRNIPLRQYDGQILSSSWQLLTVLRTRLKGTVYDSGRRNGQVLWLGCARC